MGYQLTTGHTQAASEHQLTLVCFGTEGRNQRKLHDNMGQNTIHTRRLGGTQTLVFRGVRHPCESLLHPLHITTTVTIINVVIETAWHHE